MKLNVFICWKDLSEIQTKGKGPSNVVEPQNLGTDPDPRICTTDLRIRILLFSSEADKMPEKISIL